MVEIVRPDRPTADSKGLKTQYPRGASATQVTETRFNRPQTDKGTFNKR